MKQLFIAIFFFAAINSHAQNEVQGTLNDANQLNNTLEGTWKLVPILPSDTAAGKIPSITFDLKTNKFSGNTGCNSMSGSFETKQDALKFDEHIISTKMACAGFNEKTFFDNLIKANRFEIKNGVLQIMYNTTVLSQWSRNVNTNPVKQI